MSQKGLISTYRKLSRTPPSEQKSAEAKLGVSLTQLFDQYQADIGRCPDCDNKMAWMGLDFKVPPKDDREQWKIVEVLYNNDFAFRGCGCNVGYRPPSNVSELPNWLEKHSRKTKAEKLLSLFESRV